MNWMTQIESMTSSVPNWFGVLADIAFRGCLVLIVAFAVIALARRASAAKRHFIWLSAFVALLLLPMVSVFAPLRTETSGCVAASLPSSFSRLPR